MLWEMRRWMQACADHRAVVAFLRGPRGRRMVDELAARIAELAGGLGEKGARDG